LSIYGKKVKNINKKGAYEAQNSQKKRLTKAKSLFSARIQATIIMLRVDFSCQTEPL
jgi:hypothetical protein